ncbi:matrixin family metalloprotease, partial [Rhodanobacter sp. ANJX3]|uniref:matrixin family metalloprotease n=1 Tax=Rhodanobacter sp. ANJX3 TaxID=2723083 RepID=UPI0016205E5B
SAGSQTSIDGTGETLNVADNSGSDVTFGGYSSATVNGSGVSLNLGYDASITLTQGDTNESIIGYDSVISANGGSFSLAGNGNDITASNTTITVGDNQDVTITGSNDVIDGGSGDTFNVDGTDISLTADDSSAIFQGSDAGDVFSGSGNDWSDPSLDQDGGGYFNGGYGYGGGGDGYYDGLTRYGSKDPSAVRIAAAERTGSVYEGASWTDKVITWSFANASGDYSDAITDNGEQAAVEQAFQTWAKASGFKFEEVAAGASADIEVGFSDLDTAATNEIGQTRYSTKGANLNAGVQVELEDPSQVPLTTNTSGALAYTSTDATFEQVALHEIGHALGLADTDVAGSIMNAVLGSTNQTLDTADIANIQGLYGYTPTSAKDNLKSSAQSRVVPSSQNDGQIAQLHQLVQAMASFDAGDGGWDTFEPPIPAWHHSAVSLAATPHMSSHPAQLA